MSREETWVRFILLIIIIPLLSININVFSRTQTPDGIIKKKHWRALLEVENHNFYNMKVAYRLTPDHSDPKYSQKMNVPMAFDVHIILFI